MPYKHFGARLARLDRFDSCTLHQSDFAPVVQRIRIVGLHPTDEGSTPERRTILLEGSATFHLRRPRQLLARSGARGWLTRQD